jgi:acetate kinase
MRQIEELAADGNTAAKLAIDMYCYRIKKYIGAYFAALGQLDALVFTGGVGENAADIRSHCCSGLSQLGIVVDEKKNSRRAGQLIEIQSAKANVRVLVIPTDEELEIAKQTEECIKTLKPVRQPIGSN